MAQKNISNINVFTLDSDLTSAHPITFGHNQHFVNEIIDDIFDERKGTCDITSSQCSSLKLQASEYSYDKRLKYWKQVLEERQRLSHRICQQTSKRPKAILYNDPVTVDERDKQTVKNILDYADRMDPVKLSVRQPLILPAKMNEATCQPMSKLHETLPKAEREGGKMVEISGLSNYIKLEMLGGKAEEFQSSKKPKHWLRSNILETRIAEKRDSIERVVEYYPEIENLQVIGEALPKAKMRQHNSQIELLESESICKLSSETPNNEKSTKVPIDTQLHSSIDYAVKINDQIVYKNDDKSNATSIIIETNFTAHPFCREFKKIMSIQNIGQKVLDFKWCHRSYYGKNSTLMKPTDQEFAFDHKPFRLCREEIKHILVLYQPRKVGIVKCKWVLKVGPTFFRHKMEGIVIRLVGTCEPHMEYKQKLDEIQNKVLQKSKFKMMYKLTANLGALTPQLEPVEISCPYKRKLNDLELFEQLNPGYICERYHDMELLKDFYKRIKKPRDMFWDLNVDSIKSLVFTVPNPERRGLLLNELNDILDNMKGQSMTLEQRIMTNPEKQKTCLVYVRGLITASIDEWELQVFGLEKTFKNTCHQFEDKLDAGQENQYSVALSNVQSQHKHLKAFRDSLYLQTHNLLCNLTENIANVIETTELF